MICLQVKRNDRLINLEDVHRGSLTKMLALKTLGPGCLKNISHLKLNGRGDYGKKFITTLHGSCKQITHLSLNGGTSTDSFGSINEETLDELGKFPLIDVKFGLIKFSSASFRTFLLKCQPQLQGISFDDCFDFDVNDIAATCKNLASFGYESSFLTFPTPEPQHLVALLHSNLNIKKFRFKYYHYATPMNVDILMALMQLNHLERIGFTYWERNDDLTENFTNHFYGLLEKFRNLKCVDLCLRKPQQVSRCF